MDTFQKVLDGMKILERYEPQEVFACDDYIQVDVEVAPRAEDVVALQNLGWEGRSRVWEIEVDPV